MATLIFHSMAGSAYLWTAMLAADEKGIDYELNPLVLGSEAHLQLHPFGKMPVMQHGEVILYETLAITHYIDRAFEGPPLQPSDALGQAEVLRWISLVNAYVFPIMNRFMKERLVRPNWGFEVDQAFLQAARDPLRLQMLLIGDAVADGGYLVGRQMTLADAFLLPHLLFFGRTPRPGSSR
ncbi:glutathione S-transferase family protein [Phenylobacterium sp.]|uniref:glutathione S-transferase family protein n=1 Tax=Phenylobacterium sp. TaxID=1871053 RepID=UPI002730616C|nr:glutathione S-transferase family protein [Phenylobacterium sp.]MDP1616874.1 glutathione S-transferase family protein [Phenylobacterium sp.]MDP1987431.1 glutathione S-transferase family protein [Phenylobacterium sp.]